MGNLIAQTILTKLTAEVSSLNDKRNTIRNLWLDSCNNEEYRCPEGSCIPMTYRCNGIVDCQSGADETLCGKVEKIFQKFRNVVFAVADCALEQFKCQSGGCVPKDAVCNGLNDCPDFSDEWNCFYIENTTSHLKIRDAGGEYLSVCADGWSQDQSNSACRALGFEYAVHVDQSEILRTGSGEANFILNDTASDSLLGSVVKNEQACSSGRFVTLSCHQFCKWFCCNSCWGFD